jgi:cyclase
MLKTRIIPTLLWKDVGLVKGVSFNSWRRIGSVLPAIKVYNTRQVDELIILDITAGAEERDPDYNSINDFSAECFVPLTVGGGIHTVEHIRKILRAGADKVAINSASYKNIDIIRDGTEKFGSQCIVASIDTKKIDGKYECFSQGGTLPTGKDPVSWAKELESNGAGEILITSIDRDGTMEGYDLELVQDIANAVKIPVIASGGAGNFNHMHEALKHGATAVAAASMFHFTEQTPMEAKSFLKEHGIPVRDINKVL